MKRSPILAPIIQLIVKKLYIYIYMECTNTVYFIIIIIIIIDIIIFFKLKKISKNNYENFTFDKPISSDQLLQTKTQIEAMYNMDIEAIRNLSDITRSLLLGYNYLTIPTTDPIPGTLTIPTDVTQKGNLFVQCDNEDGSGNVKIKGDLVTQATSIYVTGNLKVDGSVDFLPVGSIILWNGTYANIPNGWEQCNGDYGTPNLQNRFILGGDKNIASPAKGAVNTYGGERKHSITIAEMPSHNHESGMSPCGGCASNSGYSPCWSGPPAIGGENDPNVQMTDFNDTFGGNPVYDIMIAASGWSYRNVKKHAVGDPHNNMPPYIALIYIMRIR
jgi:microcystin-dependent protein